MLTKQVCAALALVVVAGVNAGCSEALMAPVLVEGQLFPVYEAMELRAGMSPDEVEALLGTPLRRSDGAPVVWRYDFTRRIGVCELYIGPFRMPSAAAPPPTERHALELVFGSGGLMRAVYVEVSPIRPSQRRMLFPPSNAAD